MYLICTYKVHDLEKVRDLQQMAHCFTHGLLNDLSEPELVFNTY